ncbi:cell envelope integrity protein TolA [Providencia manganoxydans]|uniref:cell envelope integrity protein TolA n=1 Tax=Providencia manganoxydans TaxID=2923283 RepID=UPI0034E5EBBF
MYNIGTVTTTANSTKLIGVDTKWKENINLVLPMQMIQIQIGSTVHNNSIHSIQSNTELTLNFPIPTAQTGAKYVIFTTTMDSISAAANAIVAMNASNVQFSDIQNRIMTESGVIDIKLPDGTVRKTRTEAERDKLLDGKFDKTGGDINGRLDVTSVVVASQLVAKTPKDSRIQLNPIDTGPRIEARTEGGAWQIYTLPSTGGAIMKSGDFGIGSVAGFEESPAGSAESPFTSASRRLKLNPTTANYQTNIFWTISGPLRMGGYTNNGSGAKGASVEFYSTGNTTKDSNGNLKAASPIVKVFADHIELNEESEGVELEKLGTGRYKLKGVLGMNSDASWGGIHGGMVIPNGINNLPLVWGSFDVLPDGDIIIETRYRKHELNERQEAERLMTYPEFLKEELVEVDTEEGKKEKLLKVEREDYEYCDIPNGHWIDVRVNMPSNSIYNLKQAEAERLAKEEADKQAEEEAKNAEIEAEEDI